MIITNFYNLPAPIVEACRKKFAPRNYNDTTFSITELMQPPRITWLKRRMEADIVQDVTELLWALYGTAMHMVLEMAQMSNALTEERLTVEIDGITITGQPDLYLDLAVLDWKNTSVWSVIYADRKHDWVRQVNGYAYLLRKHGFPVNVLEIVAFMRDWQRSRARKGGDYPRFPVKVLPIDVWPDHEVEALLRERIQLVLAAKKELPLCTSEDRWESKTTYAVMATGAKRAKRVLDSMAEAESWIATEVAEIRAHNETAKRKKKEPSLGVEVRPGEHRRCAEYCSVADFCTQWKDIQTAAAAAENPSESEQEAA